MSSLQIIYASRPFGFDEAMLAGILLDARRCNARDDITGALIVRSDLYLQLLEGPKAAVEVCYGRIIQDDRHLEPQQLLSRTITNRMFPDWAMLDDPAQSWVWSMQDLRDGAIETTTEDEVLGFFTQLAAKTAALLPKQ